MGYQRTFSRTNSHLIEGPLSAVKRSIRCSTLMAWSVSKGAGQHCKITARKPMVTDMSTERGGNSECQRNPHHLTSDDLFQPTEVSAQLRQEADFNQGNNCWLNGLSIKNFHIQPWIAHSRSFKSDDNRVFPSDELQLSILGVMPTGKFWR